MIPKISHEPLEITVAKEALRGNPSKVLEGKDFIPVIGYFRQIARTVPGIFESFDLHQKGEQTKYGAKAIVTSTSLLLYNAGLYALADNLMY